MTIDLNEPAAPPLDSEAPPQPLLPLDRNLALDLVRVTEAAALAAGHWVGRGDSGAADAAALAAMDTMMSTVQMRGTVVSGDWDADDTEPLHRGQQVGDGDGGDWDVAVDPIDGSGLIAKGMGNALSVIAVAERDTMCDLSAVFYMDKLVASAQCRDVLDLSAPVSQTIAGVARATGKRVEEVTVVMLDRPRHHRLVDEIRSAGARLTFISDGDVTAAILAARPDTDVDLLVGIGGTREGILTACALRCMGGAMQARLHPMSEADHRRAEAAGLDTDRIMTTTDLVGGSACFFAATGISDGDLLPGVRFRGAGATTQSIVMRSASGTIRHIEAHHRQGDTSSSHRLGEFS